MLCKYTHVNILRGIDWKIDRLRECEPLIILQSLCKGASLKLGTKIIDGWMFSPRWHFQYRRIMSLCLINRAFIEMVQNLGTQKWSVILHSLLNSNSPLKFRRTQSRE